MIGSHRSHLEYSAWLPDFLGIGAQKAGTTWLYSNLRQHPKIWMPPIKEIHYFTRLYPGSPSPLPSTPPLLRIFGRSPQDELWRQALVRALLNIRRTTWQELVWYTRFFLGRYDDYWYASLFKGRDDCVKGEITPAYSILEPDDIQHIKHIMPRVKVIYIIRNPIDRGWSAVRGGIRHRIRRKRMGREEKEQLLKETFSSPRKLERAFRRITNWPGYQLRGDYVRTLNHWQRYFTEEQFLIGFFEEIVHDPERFLSRIFDFLQVGFSKDYITALAAKKVNPSPQKKIPPQLERSLAEQYYPQIKALSDSLGGHAEEWLRDAEAILQRGA